VLRISEIAKEDTMNKNSFKNKKSSNESESMSGFQEESVKSLIAQIDLLISLYSPEYQAYAVTIQSRNKNVRHDCLREAMLSAMRKLERDHFRNFFVGLSFPCFAFPGKAADLKSLNHYHMLILLPKEDKLIERLERHFCAQLRSILGLNEGGDSNWEPDFWYKDFVGSSCAAYAWYCQRRELSLGSRSIDKAEYALLSFGFVSSQNQKRSARNQRRIEKKIGKNKVNSSLFLRSISNIHKISCAKTDRIRLLKEYLAE